MSQYRPENITAFSFNYGLVRLCELKRVKLLAQRIVTKFANWLNSTQKRWDAKNYLKFDKWMQKCAKIDVSQNLMSSSIGFVVFADCATDDIQC